MPNYRILGISGPWVKIGSIRETWLKPFQYILAGFLIILAVVSILQQMAVKNRILSAQKATLLAWVILAAVTAFYLIAAFSLGLLEYMTLSRFTLDANHFWIASIIFLISIAILLSQKASNKISGLEGTIRQLGWLFIIAGALSGMLILLKIGGLSIITRLAYTGFDLSLVLMAFISVISFLWKIIIIKGESRENG